MNSESKGIMLLTTDDRILEKTMELCQTLVEQPEFLTIRRSIEAFMSDEASKTQYQQLSEQSDYLQHKQNQGMQLNEEEVAGFESLRTSVLNNPVAKGFLDAQQAMFQIQEQVGHYVTKTFELGRSPTPDDFQGGCGSGCGCHH